MRPSAGRSALLRQPIREGETVVIAPPRHPAQVGSGLNVAVIGTGYWGPNLIRNFFEAPGSTVQTVCDLNETRLAGIAQRYPTIGLTTEYDSVLRDKDVDAVVIATPVSTHYELARRALDAGKHVWVEKPLALDYGDAMRLTELAAQKHLTLMVDHTFVYTAAVQTMKSRIESGELGDLLYYDSVRVNLGLFQHDVNVIWDLAIHDAGILDYLVPFRPVAVSASGACHIGAGSRTESIAYVTVYFAENFIAHFHVNWLAPVKLRLTTLCGTNRMIVYDDTVADEKVRIYDRGVVVSDNEADRTRLQVDYRTGDMYAPRLDSTEALQVAARHFAECIAEGKTPHTDALAGSRAVGLLSAAHRSLQAGGRLEQVTWEG